jgi:hypothetical protein
MLSTNNNCYPRTVTDGKTVPISRLDHILYKGSKPKVTYYCPSTGDIFSRAAVELAINNAATKQYPGTDHTPFSFEPIPGFKVAYLSLDNFVRPGGEAFSLWKSGRLTRICEIVNKINPDLIFFSEACRESDVSWVEMRDYISREIKMKFRMECSNSDDSSLGVACFSKSTSSDYVGSYQPYRLLEKSSSCHGSGCVIISLKEGPVIVGCHMPLDFKHIGKDNNGARAMESLINLLDQQKNRECYAMADFNTIPGTITEAMEEVLSSGEWRLTNDQFTFFGAFYAPMTDNGGVTEINVDDF